MASEIEVETVLRRWRRVEYDRLVGLGMFDGERLELLEGRLVVREPQGSSHAASVDQVGQVLARTFADGWYVRHHAPLALSENSEPEPDVAIVPGRPRDYVVAHPSTAALVVEVADSSLRLDRRFKSHLYARARVGEYWIVNLVDGVLEVYRDPQPAEGADDWSYRSIATLRPPASVTPVAAPGTQIPIADLLP